MWPAPSWLNSSVGRALHWHFIGHGFESFLHVGLYLFSQQLIARIPLTINHVISFITVQIYDLSYIHLCIMPYKGVVARRMWGVTLQWGSILSRSASCYKSHPVMHQPDNWQLNFFSASLQIFLQNIKTNLLYWVLFHRSILPLLLMLLLVPSHLTHPKHSNQTSLLLTHGHLISQAPDKRVTNLVRAGKDSWSLVHILLNPPQADTAWNSKCPINF